jgi:hypothetical protein
MAEYKLDMFKRLLPGLDKRDLKLWSKLSEDERKGFADIVALRYMSAVQTNDKDIIDYHIELANEFGNKHMWHPEIRKYPELQMMLLAMVGVGKVQRHEWMPKPKAQKKNKVLEMLGEIYPTWKRDELELYFEINSEDELMDLFESMGHQKEELKKIKAEVKKLK